jgi:hypothetical protein
MSTSITYLSKRRTFEQFFIDLLGPLNNKIKLAGEERHLKAEIKVTWILNDAIFKSPVDICIHQETSPLI